MKELEQEKMRRQQEKIDGLREMSSDQVERLNREGEAEAERIMERFKQKPPQGAAGLSWGECGGGGLYER